MTRWFVIALALALAPAGGAAPGEEPFGVFVSVPPLETLVARVGGARVRVAAMVGPGRSPATYEPTPRQMAALAEARLYVAVGVPFERVWLPRIGSENPHLRVARCGRAARAEGEAADGEADPHLWTGPSGIRALAVCARDALSEIDPAGADTYRAGVEELARSLDALDAEVRTRLARVQVRHFLVVHPAWGAFAQDYGLEQIAIERGGQEPGARSLAHIVDRARALGLRTVVAQPQFSQEPARRIAEAIGARVVVIDPLARDPLESIRTLARVLGEDGS